MSKVIQNAQEAAAEVQALTPAKRKLLIAALQAQHPNCKGLTAWKGGFNDDDPLHKHPVGYRCL